MQRAVFFVKHVKVLCNMLTRNCLRKYYVVSSVKKNSDSHSIFFKALCFSSVSDDGVVEVATHLLFQDAP